ncbi:hypothetical protein [Aliirhizobium smilacinae]|uniref:Uncharacterized protein n=1 Tax=Aliirhizobium smilacinae TaxID=1395944 RepID=A0A5C4XTL4_9HYPH|nr:hypothetical protein [Rhizobium smilacinae]TNM66481.1 hypothetical protein FHP24_09865 [Rhizobium smilacinae]
MSNSPVPAAAEGMPKFDLRQIMRDAWSIYRRIWGGSCRPANEQVRRKELAKALRNAWALARQARAAAAKTLAEKAADRVRELTAELMRLDARPWGMRSHRSATARDVIQLELASAQAVLQ